jgi:hypothetical protein
VYQAPAPESWMHWDEFAQDDIGHLPAVFRVDD